VSTDEEGIESDEVEIDLLMTRQLPEILPIKGQRIKFYYPGIKILCLKCYRSGHPKWECKQDFKTNWLEYVIRFFKSDEVDNDMLGSWVETLKQFHPECQLQKPLWSDQNADLRDNLSEKREFDKKKYTQKPKEHHQYKQKNRGVNQISRFTYHYPHPTTEFAPYGQAYPVVQVPVHDYQIPVRGRGRGYPRGRGSVRSRGRGRGVPNTRGINPAFGNRRGQFYTDVSKPGYLNK